MAKTNKQLQKEIDKLTIEKNNLVDMLEIAEKGIRGVSKILGLDGIAETTYFNDADIETIEKAIEKLQGKYEKCFEELSMKCGECEGLIKANETIVKAHNDVEKIGELENKVDEQFKVITKYEKELEEQDKEIDELKDEIAGLTPQVEELQAKVDRLQEENKELTKVKVASNNNVDYWYKEYQKLDKQHQTLLSIRDKQGKEIEELKEDIADLNESNKYLATVQLDYEKEIKELEEQKKYDWRLERYNKLQERAKKLYELTKTSNINRTEKYYNQSQEVIKLLQEELKTQIIQKNTYKKENKRLKKRRREGRYNIDKFITNLTKGAYVYVEGASRPTKLHKRLTDAIAEKQRLEKKTNKKVYILTNL